jgi:hypothetical protein
MNLAQTDTFCLLKPDYRVNLKLGIIVTQAEHFVLYSSDTRRGSDTSVAISALPDVPIYASDIETLHARHITNICTFNIWPPSYVIAFNINKALLMQLAYFPTSRSTHP